MERTGGDPVGEHGRSRLGARRRNDCSSSPQACPPARWRLHRADHRAAGSVPGHDNACRGGRAWFGWGPRSARTRVDRPSRSTDAAGRRSVRIHALDSAHTPVPVGQFDVDGGVRPEDGWPVVRALVVAAMACIVWAPIDWCSAPLRLDAVPPRLGSASPAVGFIGPRQHQSS